MTDGKKSMSDLWSDIFTSLVTFIVMDVGIEGLKTLLKSLRDDRTKRMEGWLGQHEAVRAEIFRDLTDMEIAGERPDKLYEMLQKARRDHCEDHLVCLFGRIPKDDTGNRKYAFTMLNSLEDDDVREVLLYALDPDADKQFKDRMVGIAKEAWTKIGDRLKRCAESGSDAKQHVEHNAREARASFLGLLDSINGFLRRHAE